MPSFFFVGRRVRKTLRSALLLRKERFMRNGKLLLILFIVLLLAGITGGVVYYQKTAAREDEALLEASERAKRFVPSLTYQEQDYPLKRNVRALLLIGTDNYIDDNKQYEDLPYNFNLADFLVVLVFDNAARTITPVQICRDTMCEVFLPDGSTRREQITLAHTYGTGKEDSCAMTRDTVENLLFGVPIDNFFAFTMETVPLLNDLVGGVSVKLEDDIPALGPEYVKGATILLQGKAALRFVRYRDTSLLDDNLRRMAHHRQYLTAFTESARTAINKDPDFAQKAFKASEKYLCTDLSAENVSALIENLGAYEILPAVTPSGSYIKGEEFAEYIVDESSLWSCVKTAFCA